MTMHVESPTSNAKTSLLRAALSLAPAAVGCAAGLILADRLRPDSRPAIAGALVAVGALVAMPAAKNLNARRPAALRLTHHPDRRLELIRNGDGAQDYSDETIGGAEHFVA